MENEKKYKDARILHINNFLQYITNVILDKNAEIKSITKVPRGNFALVEFHVITRKEGVEKEYKDTLLIQSTMNNPNEIPEN